MLQTEDLKISNETTEKITSRIVSTEQVRTFAEKAIGAIQERGDTVVLKNSVLRSVEKVQPIKSSDGITVLYVVNFADEQGFMVLSADKEAQNPMLSFDTKGSFDFEKIEEGSTVWAWLESGKEKISENLKSGIHPDNQGYQLWDYIIEKEVKDENGEVSTIEVSVEIANIDEADNGKGVQLRATHPNKRGWYTISPWYNVSQNLWGQGPGYSANAPSPNVHLAGCPAVAIGLLCKTWSYPSGYNYSAMPTTLNTTATNAISHMFRDIANKIPGYIWGTVSSGAPNVNSILTGLKNVGYSQAKCKLYDFQTAYNNIADWYPVLLVGFQQYGGGHIWIADGYYEQTWKYTKTKKFLGITICTETMV
jgi:hypothetical protein